MLTGEVEGVLQIIQSNHQANGYTETAKVGRVESTEAIRSGIPIIRPRELDQCLTLVNEVHKFGSNEILLALKLRDSGPHNFSRFRLPLIPSL